MTREVILVNKYDEQVGTMEKMEAHQKALLHRAFSIFIFNSKKEMVLQQRAITKYHSGALWTNACCSHPEPGEDIMESAKKRLAVEMGFTTGLNEIFNFTYRHEFDNGLTEYEFDHVFIGYYDGLIKPDKNEVDDYCFMTVDEIQTSLASNPQKFTAWFHIAFPMVRTWLQNSGKIQVDQTSEIKL